MSGFARNAVLLVAAVLLAGCARAPIERTSADSTKTTPAERMGSDSNDTPTPCDQVIPGCTAERLPDVTLREGEKSGALGPVTGSPESLISFDEGLAAAGREDGHSDAKTVQVVLGSADAEALHWKAECDPASPCDLFYGITWGGVCSLAHGGTPFYGSPSPRACVPGNWGTVIDAHTGTFIVGGTG